MPGQGRTHSTTLRIDTGEVSSLPGIEGADNDGLLLDFADELELSEQLARLNAELNRFEGHESKMRISKNQF